jgi:hypothetical protein
MKGLISGTLFLLGSATAALGACPSPNPNISAPPFVDGCPLPASGLNNLATSIANLTTTVNTKGNVFAPSAATAVGEVASFNNTTGSLLRQGAAQITDNKAGSITADGSAMTGVSQAGLTANQIYEWSIGPGSTPAPSYDGVRGVASQVAGSTVLDVNGIAGYAVNYNPRSGSAQVSGGLKGISVCAANNTSCWGQFAIVADGLGTSGPALSGVALFHEYDYNVRNAGTTVGFLIGGTWQAQPVSATGPTVLKPVGTGSWQYAFGTADGCCTTAFRIGAMATSGTSINSQNVDLHWFNPGGSPRTTSVAATPGGILITNNDTPLANSIALNGAAVFATGAFGGMRVNNTPVISGDNAGIAFICSDSGWATCNVGVGGAETVAIQGPSIKLTGIATTPGGKQPVCIDTGTGQIYKGASGAC